MEWDIKRVYSAVNADEVKIGSKVICANTIADLKKNLEEDDVEPHYRELKNILTENNVKRFRVQCPAFLIDFALCYLVEEPSEPKLKWTDLKIGDVIRAKDGSVERLITGVIQNSGDFNIHIEAGSTALSDKNLELWEKV